MPSTVILLTLYEVGMYKNDLENFRYIDNSIFLDPVSYREVSDAVLGLNNSSALDIDDIQVKLLK